jgi:hypothetical protein
VCRDGHASEFTDQAVRLTAFGALWRSQAIGERLALAGKSVAPNPSSIPSPSAKRRGRSTKGGDERLIAYRPCQFTSLACTSVALAAHVPISTHDHGRSMDNGCGP